MVATLHAGRDSQGVRTLPRSHASLPPHARSESGLPAGPGAPPGDGGGSGRHGHLLHPVYHPVPGFRGALRHPHLHRWESGGARGDDENTATL